MTLTIEEISDRFEIQDLLVAYSHAVDTRDWDALTDVFTPDAVVDYTDVGGPQGTLEEIRAFLDEALTGFASTQHLVGTTALTLAGDAAEGRTICHNPMVLPGEAVLFVGLWYRDSFVRTPEGWRISQRRAERSYLRSLPAEA